MMPEALGEVKLSYHELPLKTLSGGKGREFNARHPDQ